MSTDNIAFATSTLTEPSPERLDYSARSWVRLTRDTQDVSASGNADFEPSQTFTFAAPDSPLQLDYVATGTFDLPAASPTNGNTARFSLLVQNLTQGTTLLQTSLFSPDDYRIADSLTLLAAPGDLYKCQHRQQRRRLHWRQYDADRNPRRTRHKRVRGPGACVGPGHCHGPTPPGFPSAPRFS